MPKNPRQRRSGPVPDHPVARGRAGAVRSRAVSTSGAGREAAAGGCARLRAGRGRRGADRRAAVRPLQCRRLCGAFRRPRCRPAKRTRRGMVLNDEVIACGTAPTRPVLSGTATSIATGGPVPRGADAIVMVEHTQPAGPRAIEIRRAASPGQFVSYAGSDIARGEALLRAGTVIGSREIGMLAACGIAQVLVARRPRVAIISTGDELVQPGRRCARPRSTTPTARSSPRRSARTAARRCFSARSPTMRRSSKPRCARRWRRATCWCCRAAPQRRGRRLPPHHRAARQARHHRPWRRAEAGQAAVSCGLRRQAGRHPAGISDLGDVHLPRHDRAGAAADGRPAAAFRCQGHAPRCRCGSPPNSAAPNSSWCRWSKASDGLIAYPYRQGLRRDHVLCAGRRFPADRCAGRSDAGRQPRPR